MVEAISTWAGNLLLALVVSIITSLITVRLALGRFREEQWWSRKANAYSAILEALHYAKACDENCLDEFPSGQRTVSEYQEELLEKGRKADRDIWKAIDVSEFLLGEEAVRVLNELRKDLERADEVGDYIGALQPNIHALSKCLKALPRIAKADLGVR